MIDDDADIAFKRLLATGGRDTMRMQVDTSDLDDQQMLATINTAAGYSDAAREALQGQEFGASVSLFWMSLSYERTIGSPFRMANDYGNLGIAYLHLEQYELARAALNESLRLYDKANSAGGAAKTYYWLAQWELRHKNLQRARQFAEYSLALFEKHEHPYSQGSRELLEWIKAQ